MKPFLLKRFDEDIAVLNLSEEGHILDYKIVGKNEARNNTILILYVIKDRGSFQFIALI